MVTASMVKELREKTGAGMMDCKRALSETDGDVEKAIELLREKGLAAAAKKSGRIAAEGLVCTYISEDMKVGAVVEVNCETDFVAVNNDFVTLANNTAKQAAQTNSTTIEEFTSEKCMADETITINDAVTALIAKLGENMSVRRFQKFSIENGVVQSYIHGGGRIGVLVELSCEKQDDVLIRIAKDVAMQIAAASPLFLDNTCVDKDTLEKEKEIYRVQAINEGKPEKIIEKMVMGRVNKYFKEVCLLEQVWVKNADYTITKYLKEESKKLGAEIKVTRFERFERGEGIEKKEENFAEEVQRQVQGK
ncbi:translation elongation factor Ts [Clostridium estertheticum]|uniref:Elongation factor Ts n=1 Tax=Clostridium estertheticum subsp. estertheticum TaxID=1552 RepID=A0A1J0GJ29_9CLOT|nr:translation elongation factor Ts [Clostridium estertheticum]APC40926.1 translation elongation factor Ts [Clostridium estertheticum subsp. estertheticum]MBU3073985.1 translation elongation factor Ts [Clostridium estertheticum]MBU3164079.1 translation elongation factor Ts [Clostridium estertheticum]MBZ9617209.1 translation elongation factor Ts [Clostridium estertheticum subsp. laramiense]WAG72900.1 translation elongation factor Ts [Clostridium estertheticum]